MSRVFRGAFIVWIVLRYGLDELVLSSFRHRGLRLLTWIVTIGRRLDAPRGQRLREALERLGPIFVKFGQVLSTRRDLLPADIADELARLQDRVPPFSSELAVAMIEKAFRKPVSEIFTSFDREPIASASIAQVHFAVLKDRGGVEREVAVKVLRPNMLAVIDKDLSLMRTMAGWLDALSADGKRLKPREVVAEFDKYLHDELDLVREASSAAQLRRNMAGLDLVLIPEMFWDYCQPDVIVMERMKASRSATPSGCARRGVDIKKLARDGVTIFFTQVFRDGFFPRRHAPGQHPGERGARHVWALHFARFRHHRDADRVRQGIPGAELHGVFSAATTSVWPNSTSSRAGCRPRPAWTNWNRHPQRLRTVL